MRFCIESEFRGRDDPNRLRVVSLASHRFIDRVLSYLGAALLEVSVFDMIFVFSLGKESDSPSQKHSQGFKFVGRVSHHAARFSLRFPIFRVPSVLPVRKPRTVFGILGGILGDSTKGLGLDGLRQGQLVEIRNDRVSMQKFRTLPEDFVTRTT